MIPYYRKNLYVLWVAAFLAGASWNQVVPFLPLYLTELGATENVSQWSGLIYSMHFLSALVMMPVWGKLSDRVGRKPMAIRAGVSLSIIYFAMSLCRTPWQLALCRFLNGALTGFIPMSTALLATNTPKAYASRYVASMQTAVASGNLLGPALGAVMASAFGIRGAMRVSGFAVFFSSMLVLAFVQERNKPTGTVERTSIMDDFRVAFKSPTLWVVLFINVVASIGTVGIQPILALHVEDLVAHTSSVLFTGMKEALVATVFMLPAIGFVLTATRWVRLSDKYGVQRIVTISLIGGGITSIMTGLTGNIAIFLFIFFVSGLFLAALRPTAAAVIATDVEPAFHGRAFGMQTSAQTIGGLIGPITGGILAGAWGNQSVFIGVGLMLLLSPFAMRRLVPQEEASRNAASSESLGT